MVSSATFPAQNSKTKDVSEYKIEKKPMERNNEDTSEDVTKSHLFVFTGFKAGMNTDSDVKRSANQIIYDMSKNSK